jgi:hypothetical protein
MTAKTIANTNSATPNEGGFLSGSLFPIGSGCCDITVTEY